jgi:ABC-type oligopeptide transport system substrate-binding subunit
VRALIVVVALAAGGCALHESTTGGRRWFGAVIAPADEVFSFNLGAEPESTDPALASGQPDGIVCRMLFEGLTRADPRTLEPLPGQAERWDVSPDGLVYRFHLRHDIQWSDGRPVTAEDFRWSWLRVLKPATGSRYASTLLPIRNAARYNSGELTDSSAVGIRATDDSTLIVTLEHPTAYFLYLVQFYTALPVRRDVVERWGLTWTRPEHVIGNGAFTLASWRQNDRFVLARNPRYWNAMSVGLQRVVAYTIDDLNTSINLYKAGVIDWNPSGGIPSSYIPSMRRYADYRHGRFQAIYFYSINVSRKPFDDVWVRRALNLALDREAITRDLLKGSRDPWGNMTPSGYPGYTAPPALGYDPARARECLAKAGYPGGRGFPPLRIVFNTSEDNRRIAEAVQAMWTRTLGIPVELENQEWGSLLQTMVGLQYDVVRRSWIGDYLDPDTFLQCFRSGDGNNRTGWREPRYDALLAAADAELDPARRMKLLSQAEGLLLDEGPVIPIYHYSTNELVKPYVRGIYPTPLDIHPIDAVTIDRDWRNRAGQVAAGGAVPR